MRRSLRHTLLFLSAGLSAGIARAAEEPVLRDFDPQKIEEYRNRSEYDYGERLQFTFWDWLERLGERISRLLREYFNFKFPEAGIDQGDVILFIVAALAVAGIVFLIFKGKFGWLFSGRKFKTRKEPEYSVYEENIHDINFGDEIEQAVQSKNYRKAIRLFYLKSLKLLSDAGHIQWQINKTNTDYRREISHKALREEFDFLSLAFEYVWYGEFEPTEETFLETFDKFRSFNNRFTPETAQP